MVGFLEKREEVVLRGLWGGSLERWKVERGNLVWMRGDAMRFGLMYGCEMVRWRAILSIMYVYRGTEGGGCDVYYTSLFDLIWTSER